MHELSHGRSFSGSYIEYFVRSVLVAGEFFVGAHMSIDKVVHVYIVPHAGPVGCRVVISVDKELVPRSFCHIQYVGEDICRHSGRSFSYFPRRMRAYGIEVSQRYYGEAVVSCQILQYAFAYELGTGIRMLGSEFSALVYRTFIIRMIDGCGTGKNHFSYIESLHYGKKCESLGDIVFIIAERVETALFRDFESGKVYDGIHRVCAEDLRHLFLLSYVRSVKRRTVAEYGSYSLHRCKAGVAEIVDDNRFVSCFLKGDYRMGADISESSGYEDSLFFRHVFSFWSKGKDIFGSL